MDEFNFDDEDFNFGTLLDDESAQVSSTDTSATLLHQQQPTILTQDPSTFYQQQHVYDFLNQAQQTNVAFQTPNIIPVMFNNAAAAAMLHPSMFSNVFAFNTSPTQQLITGSVSSNSLSPLGNMSNTTQQNGLTITDLSNTSTSGSSDNSKKKKQTAPRKKKKVDTTKSKHSNSSSDSDENSEKARKKSIRKRDAEEIDADMKRLTDLEKAQELTEQQKEEKKKLRNRYTAKVSRDKKKRELETLRDENNIVVKKLEEANMTIKSLREQNESLSNENIYLKAQLSMVYTTYNASATMDNNGKRNTVMRSAIVLLGVLCLFVLFAFLTGSSKYSSNDQSFSPQSPQTAKRLARGLLSINSSMADVQPNSRTSSSPKSIPKSSVLSQQHHSTHSASSQHLPEPIYVENTMEMGESLEEDFNPDGMMSYDVFYPSKLKRHFSSFSYHQQPQKHNASEAAHIRSYDNSTSTSATPIVKSKKKSLTSQSHNNSKQISVLTKPTMLNKRMEEKKHKYEKATVYVPSESSIPNDKSAELHMFCPYLYPLVAGIPDTGYEFSTKDFEGSKKSSMKIHIPIQMVCNKTNTKVIRMAEINAENITLSDVFYEFNGPSLPPRPVEANCK